MSNELNSQVLDNEPSIPVPLLEEDPNKIAQNIISTIKDIEEESALLMAQTQALNNKEQNRVMQQQLKRIEQEAQKREEQNRIQQQKLQEAQYFQAILKDVTKAIPDITKAEDFVNKIQDSEFMAQIAKANHYSQFINAVNNKDAKETIAIIKDTFNKKNEEQMAVAEIGGLANSTTQSNNTNTLSSNIDIKKRAKELRKNLTNSEGRLDIKTYREQLLDSFIPRTN